MFNFFKNKNNKQKKLIIKFGMSLVIFMGSTYSIFIDYKDASRPIQHGRRP